MYTQYYSKDNLEKGQVYNVVGAIYIDDDVVKLAPTSAPTVLPDAVTSDSSNEGVIEAFFKHPIKFVAKNASKMIFKLGDADEETVDVTNATDFSLEYTPNTGAEEVSLTVTPVAADGDAWSARATTFTLKLTKAPEPKTPVVTSNGEAVDGAYNIYRFTDITITSENALSLGVKIGEDGTETKVAIADNQFTYTPKFDNDEWPASFSLFVTPYDDVDDAYTTVEIKFTVVDRPSAVVTITPEAGAVDYNTKVTLKGDDNTVEIHYTVNDGEEQTYTEDSSIKLREATTITAWGINADKKAGEKATATFTVGEPDSYSLVTSLDQLKDGATYVLVGNSATPYYVMTGGLTSSGYYNATSLGSTYTLGDDITDPDVTFTKLVISKVDESHYTLYDVAAGKYIGVKSYQTGNSGVNLTNVDSANEVDSNSNKLAQFTIAIDETANYKATITDGNFIQFNSNRFKTYGSAQKPVYLYILNSDIPTEPEQPEEPEQPASKEMVFDFSTSKDMTNDKNITLESTGDYDAKYNAYLVGADGVTEISSFTDDDQTIGIKSIAITVKNSNDDSAYKFEPSDKNYVVTIANKFNDDGELASYDPDKLGTFKIDDDGNMSWTATSNSKLISDFTFANENQVVISKIEITWDYVTPVIIDCTVDGTKVTFSTLKGHKVYYRKIATPTGSTAPAQVSTRREDLNSDQANESETTTTYTEAKYLEVVNGTDGWTVTDTTGYTCDFTGLENGESYEIKIENGDYSIVGAFGKNDNGDVVTGIAKVIANAANGVEEWYNLQGVRVANPTTGIFIHRVGNRVEKVVLK
jgi:hypothetical protein